MIAEVGKVAIFLGASLLVGSWLPRIWLFARFSEDPVFAELAEGTHATTFYDFLSFTLFSARFRMPKESRTLILFFCALHWSGGALLMMGVFLILASK